MDFGKNGRVDLRAGLGRDPESLTLVQSTTPGRVFENLLILGSATNEEYESGPGDIRAYNVLTGSLVWTFHTVPHPGEFGYDTWPKDAWKTVGGANAWSGLSLDEKRGIVFIPTASPKYNFYGANRTGANLFGDCLIALNARTGKLIWYFQMVHHDIWDYDNATSPMLLTVRHNGKMVDVVAQAGKEGFVWVFNRETGEPLWPIEERAVPRSDMPGEVTWPTQPFPSKPPPFARQSFTVKDLNPFMETEEREQLRKEMEGARNQGLFTPPGLTNTVEMPGNNGGANFQGAAVDPEHGTLVCRLEGSSLHAQVGTESDGAGTGGKFSRGKRTCRLSIQLPLVSRCGPGWSTSGRSFPGRCRSETDCRSNSRNRDHGRGPMPAFARTVRRISRFSRRVSFSIPSVRQRASPTAVLLHKADTSVASGKTSLQKQFRFHVHQQRTACHRSALDDAHCLRPESGNHSSGKCLWEKFLNWRLKGFTNTGSHFPKVGPVVTAGGLIFTGTRDKKVRALDSATGKVLWEKEAGAALEGMPAVYAIDGREYVVFCAAAQATTHTHDLPGHPALQAPVPGAYIVFALPAEPINIRR